MQSEHLVADVIIPNLAGTLAVSLPFATLVSEGTPGSKRVSESAMQGQGERKVAHLSET